MRIAISNEDDLSEFITQLEHIVNFKRRKSKIPKKDNYKDKKADKTNEDKDKEATCYSCGKKGHKSTKFPTNNKEKNKRITLVDNEDNQIDISDNHSSKK